MVYTLSVYRSQNLESEAARISFATLGYKLLVMCSKIVGIAPCMWSTNWDSFAPQIGGSAMAGKREKPEEIVSKLRQVEVLQGQGMTVADAVRQIGVTQQTFY